MMINSAIVDLETTGLDPTTHEILEVAIYLLPELELLHFSLPIDTSKASPQALKTNHYFERRAELLGIQEEHCDAVYILRDALKGRLFIGNNPSFDAAFLRQYLGERGIAPNWHYHIVDLKALVAGRYGIAPPWSTAQIAEAIGVPLSYDAHTAAGDVAWNYLVYQALNLGK